MPKPERPPSDEFERKGWSVKPPPMQEIESGAPAWAFVAVGCMFAAALLAAVGGWLFGS